MKYYHDQEEIIVAEKNTERRHLINVIKFEGEDDALVWKHPVEDFNLAPSLLYMRARRRCSSGMVRP